MNKPLPGSRDAVSVLLLALDADLVRAFSPHEQESIPSYEYGWEDVRALHLDFGQLTFIAGALRGMARHFLALDHVDSAEYAVHIARDILAIMSEGDEGLEGIDYDQVDVVEQIHAHAIARFYAGLPLIDPELGPESEDDSL